ncbi:MAG TPA: hypothetical protein VNG89_21175, partial [Vicinamibacterales bacterium]|nr:hypothetical protein [Vicinamibacterales bacterium]
MLAVIMFSGASGIGATAGSFAPNGGSTVSLTTTRAGSLVYGVGNDWNGAVPRTIGDSQTKVHEFVNDATGDTIWVQALTNPVSLGGVQVQLNDTAPTDHEWNFAAVEITPSAKATPTITWPAPAAIITGAPLGSAQLNATASVPGTFVYTPASGTVLTLGTHTLTASFTPTDTSNYVATTTTVDIAVVDKLVPTLTWPLPADIVFGTPLSATQLNATANVPGTFEYDPPVGTVLPVGAVQTLSVTFTPTDTATYTSTTRSVPLTVLASPLVDPPPVKIGTTAAGTFKDATGHSGQSHLVFAPNAGVWWLFTLSSAHDSFADHTVRSYFSSGSDLTTATWTESSPSPHLADLASNSLFAGGRSLGIALVSIGGVDYVHVFASMAFDGQRSSNGHIRAQLGTTSIAWGAWNNPGSPNTASQWQGPSGTGGSGAANHSSWGNSIGISTGGFVHHFSSVLDQEIDCNVGRSTNADTASSWTNGFGTNQIGKSPNSTVAVIDKTMTHECKVLAFAPLANDVMLAVYTNGMHDGHVNGDQGQPFANNLRFQTSGASGTWTNVASSGGSGDVFATTANIDQNDWTLVPVTTSTIYVFRRNAGGSGVDGASYAAATNTWTPMS